MRLGSFPSFLTSPVAAPTSSSFKSRHPYYHRCHSFIPSRGRPRPLYHRRLHRQPQPRRGRHEAKATINDAASTAESSLDELPTTLPTRSPRTTKPQLLPKLVSLSAIDRSIARIALPALGALSLDPLVALADTAFVGHLGAKSLGAVSVSNTIFNLSFVCFNFLYLTTTPSVARAIGSKDHDQASRLISHGFWIAIIVGTIAMTLISRNATFLVSCFATNDEVVPFGVKYLKARIVGAPFFLASMVGNGAFRGFQDTRTCFRAGIFASIVNLILFPTLIYWRKLGVAGAGYATAAGQIVSGCYLFALLLKSGRLKGMDLIKRPRWKEIWVMLTTGAVLSIRAFSIMTTISFATSTTSKLGTVPLAAFEIGKQMFTLIGRLLDAVAVAAQSLVALAIGQGQYKRARQSANRILQLGLMMGLGFGSILMIGARQIPKFLTSDPSVRELATKTFPVFAIVQPLTGLVFCMDGVYTAGRRFGFLTSAIFTAAAVSFSLLLLVRTKGLGLPFVWMALNVMMVLRSSFLVLGYLSKKWTPVPWERGDRRASQNGTPEKRS